jgi:galactokinase
MRQFWAPGRVNLLGEYTDLVGGLVLPAALDVGIRVAVRPAEEITLRSEERAGVVHTRSDGTPIGGPPRDWARYVAAVAVELDLLGRPPVGLEGRLTSTLPIGAGLSSSAALEVAIALALCELAAFRLDPLELALACQRAEHRAVGVPCGLMDQAASTLAREGHVLLLDTSSLQLEHVPFPPALALVVVDSRVTRALEHSAYAERRRELQAATEALAGRAVQELAAADVDGLGLPPLLARRLRHVVHENARVREAADALREGDTGRLCVLFREGHESLRSDLEVSTPELDLLVELAYSHGAVAARMTGGGFGGSIVALTEAANAEAVAARVQEAYRAATGRVANTLVTRPGAGAHELA